MRIQEGTRLEQEDLCIPETDHLSEPFLCGTNRRQQASMLFR